MASETLHRPGGDGHDGDDDHDHVLGAGAHVRLGHRQDQLAGADPPVQLAVVRRVRRRRSAWSRC